MKKLLLLCGFLAITILGFAEETKRVAILEVVDKEGKLSYTQKLMLRSNLAKAVTNTEGYEAYDRTDIDAILNEQDFQRTGMVSDDQIKQLGVMTGAAYILVAEGAIADEANIFVTAKVLNVETGRIVMTETAIIAMAAKNMQRGCSNLAYNLFNNLTGSGNSAASTSKFLSLFKAKTPDEQKQYEDSVAAAQKAEQAALAAQAKEQKRQEAEQQRLAEAQRKQAEAEQKRLAEEQRKKEEAERAKLYITRHGNEYEHMGNMMDKKAYAAFLQNNSPVAYSQYQKGKKLANAGWGTFATGLALMAGGAACLIIENNARNNYTPSDRPEEGGDYNPDYYQEGDNGGGQEQGGDGYGYAPERRKAMGIDPYDQSSVLTPVGIAALSVGGAATVVSVSLLAAGYSKQNNAYKVYNKKSVSQYKTPMSLDLTVGKSCVGIALRF